MSSVFLDWGSSLVDSASWCTIKFSLRFSFSLSSESMVVMVDWMSGLSVCEVWVGGGPVLRLFVVEEDCVSVEVRFYWFVACWSLSCCICNLTEFSSLVHE